MNHNYIGTEHLLLGILKQPKDPATKLLAEHNVTLESAESWLTAELDRILKAR
jgi:ATP-dependent Clp protease ATP-binding subunit ClpA